MKLNTVLKRMPGWYAEAISDRPDRCRCVYLKSPPGRGKTSVLSEAPKLIGSQLGLNLGIVIINGPLLTPPDSVGYLVPKHEDGHAESLFTDPFWWRTEEGKRLEEYDGGIIVVDEADKMDTDVKKVIGEAALSGRLGPHRLPSKPQLKAGWVVWMAGNRSEDRSGSTKELDHLINRRREINITDDLESWTDWAVTRGVMPLTIAFAHQNPQIVFEAKVPEKQGPWCTPRSLVMVDGYLQTLGARDGMIPDDPDTIEEVGGNIGDGAAAQLFSFVRLEREMPKFEQIVKDPKGAKVPTKPDAQMLVCYNLAHRVSQATAEPVITYMERMPKEFAVTFAHAACKRDFTLVQADAVQKWVARNSSLMASIAR